MPSAVPFRDAFWNVSLWAALGASMLVSSPDISRAAEPPTGLTILQEMRSFSTMGSVLYIAAHPDDENTQAITYLARGRGYRTAYLSLTRGDGGQNLLGPQLHEQLGVARTQELLAARRLDGGRQYFTRAKDFGYSKDYRETERIWDRQAVLADIVRVIRGFRPDVIVTRFSPQPGDTHGHHTASAVLALEAFNLAGDPQAFPEQLGELTPWQPKRIFHNVGPFGGARADAASSGTGVVRVEVGGNEAVLGETLKMRHTAVVRSRIPVRWTAVRYLSIPRTVTMVLALRANHPVSRDTTQILPATTPVSQPYWLRKEGTAGLFHVDDPSLIGRPENPAAFPIDYVFEVGGQTLVIAGEPAAADPANEAMRRRLDVIPPVSLRFTSGVQLFAPGAARPVTVELTAARARAAGTVQLDAPAGWRVIPAAQPFRLAAAGERVRFTFSVTAPSELATAKLGASVTINGVRFNHQRVELRYDHIPFQLLQPAATLNAVSLDLAIRGRHVGYLPGAGDDVAGCLQQMGYAVTQLTSADLSPETLRPLDAVVIGIRAFNTRADLAERLPALFACVEAGGNVIA